MKSFVKRLIAITLLLGAVIGWPIEGVNVKPIVKRAVPLLSGCVKKSTKVAEEQVNKSTQVVEGAVNKAVQNNSRGIVRTGYFGTKNAIRSNAQTTALPQMTVCSKCYGTGRVKGNDGYVYSCSYCKGTGRIVTKSH